MASLRRNYFRDLPVARALVEKAKGKNLLTVTASQVSGSRKPLNLTLADPLQKSLSGLPSLAHTAYQNTALTGQDAIFATQESIVCDGSEALLLLYDLEEADDSVQNIPSAFSMLSTMLVSVAKLGG